MMKVLSSPVTACRVRQEVSVFILSYYNSRGSVKP